MREIKFRAWDKNTNSYADMIRNMDLGPDGVDCIVDNYGINLDVSGECELEQYTGLKDANGIDIYENDIIRIDHDEITKVEFGRQTEEEDFGAYYNYLGYNFFLGWSYESPEDLYKIEVIGNVHQNPELLEG